MRNLWKPLQSAQNRCLWVFLTLLARGCRGLSWGHQTQPMVKTRWFMMSWTACKHQVHSMGKIEWCTETQCNSIGPCARTWFSVKLCPVGSVAHKCMQHTSGVAKQGNWCNFKAIPSASHEKLVKTPPKCSESMIVGVFDTFGQKLQVSFPRPPDTTNGQN